MTTLDTVKVECNKKKGKIGLTCESPDEAPTKAIVSELASESIAELRIGDRIVSINGKKVKGHKEAIRLRRQRVDAARLHVAV